jgi:hypothetical protein
MLGKRTLLPNNHGQNKPKEEAATREQGGSQCGRWPNCSHRRKGEVLKLQELG